MLDWRVLRRCEWERRGEVLSIHGLLLYYDASARRTETLRSSDVLGGSLTSVGDPSRVDVSLTIVSSRFGIISVQIEIAAFPYRTWHKWAIAELLPDNHVNRLEELTQVTKVPDVPKVYILLMVK